MLSKPCVSDFTTMYHRESPHFSPDMCDDKLDGNNGNNDRNVKPKIETPLLLLSENDYRSSAYYSSAEYEETEDVEVVYSWAINLINNLETLLWRPIGHTRSDGTVLYEMDNPNDMIQNIRRR